ncbi:hypothetical protein ACI2TP_24805 [Ralstonia nicotianae]
MALKTTIASPNKAAAPLFDRPWVSAFGLPKMYVTPLSGVPPTVKVLEKKGRWSTNILFISMHSKYGVLACIDIHL